ncbi:MAG: hypothetical protein ACLTKI_07155 [Lachnospiraceae bacterium]
MRASIMSEKMGLEQFSDVRMVRIKSRNYTLLIMEDFAPTLGRIRGDVCILTQDDEVIYENILGYFQQKDNVFSLLIGEKRYEERRRDAK